MTWVPSWDVDGARLWWRHGRVKPMTSMCKVAVASVCHGCIHSAVFEHAADRFDVRALTYWSMGADTGGSRRLGIARASRGFDTPGALVDGFVEHRRAQAASTYFTADRDASTPEMADTNWDQGRLQLGHALALIAGLRKGLAGSDINCGFRIAGTALGGSASCPR